MAKFLLACYPIPGHLNPNIALALELRSRGHEVAFYSGSKAEAAISSEGFKYFGYHPQMDEILNSILTPEDADEFVTSDLTTMRFPALGIEKINKYLKNWFLSTIEHQLKDLEDIQQAWSPDAVVADISLFGPLIFLHDLTKLPVAAFCVLPACSIPGPDAPAWGRGLPPPRNIVNKVRSSIEAILRNFVLKDFRGELNRLRMKYGLPPLSVPVMKYAADLPLYLIVGTPEFDYNRQDLPENVHYIGPCLWHKPGNTLPPAWMSQLDPDKPVIYVTEGTVNVRRLSLLKAAVDGLANGEMQVIMTTGTHRDPGQIKLSPAAGNNVRIEKYIPHGDLFPYVDLVITTGGTGTILSALMHGIPLIVVPTGWDLPENAQRVVESGVGIRVDPDKCTGKRLASAVDTILNDAAYKNKARAIGECLEKRGGGRMAAKLLEMLL